MSYMNQQEKNWVKEDDCNEQIPNSQLCNYLAWRRPCYWLVWKLKSQDCEENASAIDADREEAVLILRWRVTRTRWLFFCLGTGESAAPRSIAIPSWGTSLVGKWFADICCHQFCFSCKANSACQSIKDKADHEITCYDDRVEDLLAKNIIPQDIVELKANKAPVDIVTSQGWKVEMFSVLSILSVALLSPIYWLKPIS